MFRTMPFILLVLMIAIGVVHPLIPEGVQSVLYGVSLFIKSLIVFSLPFIIFGLLFKTTVGFARNASKMILTILAVICLSNFLSTMISYSVGCVAYSFDLSMPFPNEGSELQPAWVFALPTLIGNDRAMLAALVFGVILGWWKPVWAASIATRMDKMVSYILKGVLYAIPLFIAGFAVKMYHDNVMGYILQNYGMIFALAACSVFAYISLIYFLASRRGALSFMQSVKNMAPAAIAGFGSMSSAAAMPLTLLGTEKNSQNPDLARSIIPATVNVHLIGDCFAIPIFAFAVMKSFGIEEPSFFSYLIFASYFVLAKFSVAAVPGGGILVMLPILEHYLGFNATMLSLITALYILFDPIITCANVFGNGGFAMGLSRLLQSVAPSRSR